MERIKSISEAYSMQPKLFSVREKPIDKDSFVYDAELNIKRIEKVQYEQYKWKYIGYNFDGEKMFEYLEDSVNVHYFVSPEPKKP